MAKFGNESAPDQQPAPTKKDGVDMDALAKSAEHGQGSAMHAQLQAIPVSEHLQIIKDLRQREQGNPNLNISIAEGSTPDNFSYSIEKKLDPSKLPQIPPQQLKEFAKIMGKTPAQVTAEMAEATQKDKPPVLEEKYSKAAGSKHEHYSDEKP